MMQCPAKRKKGGLLVTCESRCCGRENALWRIALQGMRIFLSQNSSNPQDKGFGVPVATGSYKTPMLHLLVER